jgi:hypothetical protein
MRKGCLVAAGLALAMSLGAGRAEAVIVVGGINFNDNAFADVLLDSFGTFSLGGAGTLEDNLVGSNVNDYAFSFTAGSFVQLGFTDNAVLNGAGNDLALFELGVPDTLQVRINGVTLPYVTVDTGFMGGGFALNVALVDLSSFGLGAGSTISDVYIGMDTPGAGTVPSLTAAGAINSTDTAAVPEPGTLLLLGSGAAMLLRRRRAGA